MDFVHNWTGPILVSLSTNQFQLTKAFCSTRCRSQFFNQRIVNVWNSLPLTVDFTSLASFKRTIASIDFSDFHKVFSF